MTSEERRDLTRLRPSTPDEIRALLQNAGIELSDALLAQFVAAWPGYEAMVRRIPRNRGYAAEPGHMFRPGRLHDSDAE